VKKNITAKLNLKLETLEVLPADGLKLVGGAACA
jgi:hypothetical protein